MARESETERGREGKGEGERGRERERKRRKAKREKNPPFHTQRQPQIITQIEQWPAKYFFRLPAKYYAIFLGAQNRQTFLLPCWCFFLKCTAWNLDKRNVFVKRHRALTSETNHTQDIFLI